MIFLCQTIPVSQLAHSVLVVVDSAICDSKDSFALRQTRRVIYLADTRLSAALSERQSCLGSMRNDMTAYGLLRISTCKHSTSIHLGHDLIGDNDSDSKLVSHALQMAEKFCKTHLARTQLSSA